MEAVITYVRGRPKETKLTYRRIDDDVVEKIVAQYEWNPETKRLETKSSSLPQK